MYYGIIKSKKNSSINRTKYEFDYIEQLKIQSKSSNQKLKKEALEGLSFLNAYLLADIDSNFAELNKLVETSLDFKREIYNERYHSKNCVLNTQDTFQFENEEELMDSISLGDAKELFQRKKLADKRISRKVKRATSEKEVA